jgi:outer membrane protein assembly factor BamA
MVGVLILAAAWASAATSPLVRSLRFSGASLFSASELQDLISTRPATPFNSLALRNDLAKISGEYERHGFWRADIRLDRLRFSSDSSTVDVEIAIDEGRPTLLTALSFTGITLLNPDEARADFETRIGNPLNQPLLEQDVAAFLKHLERLGRPFADCRIIPKELREGPEADSLNVEVEVQEGKSFSIDEVRIDGARETNPAYILRESRLKEGEAYSAERINAVRSRLNRLNIFSSVSEPEIYFRDGKGGLLIRVQEGRTNTFDGIVGYAPATGPNDQGYFTGLVSFAMRNLFGTGRRFAIRWERENQRSQELGLHYTEPWFLGLPVNLGGGFLQRQQDTAYVRRVVDLRADLLPSDRFVVGIVGSSESVIPSSDTTIRRSFQSSALTIGADLSYDSRDDPVSPTEGVRYRVDYHYGRKSSPPNRGGARLSLQRWGLDLETFISTVRRQVVAIGVHGRNVEGGDLQEGELYRFGGATTLRGYRENEFLGSRIGWVNLEYRFLAGRRTYFYGFLDGGYYFRPDSPTLGLEPANVFKYGAGIGVRLETGLGNIGVSFGMGQGDSFSTAKIHFGLLSEI